MKCPIELILSRYKTRNCKTTHLRIKWTWLLHSKILDLFVSIVALFPSVSQHYNCLPGHFLLLHGASWILSPPQSCPPCAGAGSSQNRCLIFFPPPHTLVHLVHFDHAPHRPLRTSFAKDDRENIILFGLFYACLLQNLLCILLNYIWSALKWRGGDGSRMVMWYEWRMIRPHVPDRCDQGTRGNE